MNISRRQTVFKTLALALAAAIGLAGCIEVAHVEVPAIPAPRVVKTQERPVMVRHRQVVWDLRRHFPRVEKIIHADTEYVVVEQTWLLQMAHWLDNYIRQHLPPERRREHMQAHTQTLTELLREFAEVAVAREHKFKGEVFIGSITAVYHKEWGAKPADGKTHQHLIAYTDRGVQVVDLPTYQVASAEHFPNREHVTLINF